MQTHTHEKLPPIPRAKDEEEESVKKQKNREPEFLSFEKQQGLTKKKDS